MGTFRFLVVLAIYLSSASAIAADAAGDDEDFWSAARSGDASRGEWLNPVLGESGACPELNGYLDPGGYVPNSGTMFKERYAQLKQLDRDLGQISTAKQTAQGKKQTAEASCQYLRTHLQAKDALSRYSAARDAYGKALEEYKSQLASSWNDSAKLFPILQQEIAKRQEIIKSLPAATDSMNKGIKAIQTCQKRLANMAPALKDNGKYAASLADGMKDCVATSAQK
jgi:hypothetical protein